MFINGQWVDAIDGGTFAVTNPASGDVIGSMPDGAAADAATRPSTTSAASVARQPQQPA